MNLNTNKVILAFAIIASLTVFSADLISYLKACSSPTEIQGDFEQPGGLQVEITDLSEDGDSMFHPFNKLSIIGSVNRIFSDQYSHYDHLIPGINTPPPEQA